MFAPDRVGIYEQTMPPQAFVQHAHKPSVRQVMPEQQLLHAHWDNALAAFLAGRC